MVTVTEGPFDVAVAFPVVAPVCEQPPVPTHPIKPPKGECPAGHDDVAVQVCPIQFTEQEAVTSPENVAPLYVPPPVPLAFCQTPDWQKEKGHFGVIYCQNISHERVPQPPAFTNTLIDDVVTPPQDVPPI